MTGSAYRPFCIGKYNGKPLARVSFYEDHIVAVHHNDSGGKELSFGVETSPTPVAFDESLVGKTITGIAYVKSDYCLVIFTDGGIYALYHKTSGLESVYLESVNSHYTFLLDRKVLEAHDKSAEGGRVRGECGATGYTYTHTFYTIRTLTDTVRLCWYGTSMGFSSEEPELYSYSPAVCRQCADN